MFGKDWLKDHYLRTDEGYECKYCDLVWRKKIQEYMVLHLVEAHNIGMIAAISGGNPGSH